MIKIEDIIEKLEENQFKSDLPTEFEVALTDAFSFLGFQAKTIGGKGDTDVLLTANIGKESYKVDIDGKTSKHEKVSEAQINWPSLTDHKNKNKSNFVVVVGPSFAGGNLEKRAKEFEICLLTTSDLIKVLNAHSRYPFTLLELRDLFAEAGSLSEQVNDLLTQNQTRRNFLEKFKAIIEEIEKLQNTRLGYFTFESLAGREKIQELEIELEEIESIIQLLRIPFINAISEIDNHKFVFTLVKKDLSNTFHQISALIGDGIMKNVAKDVSETKNKILLEDVMLERTLGTKYFKWQFQDSSIIASARADNPYEHYCPIDHFKTIILKIIEAFSNQNIINNDIVFQLLMNQELSPNRIFKGKSEEYKIRLTLGILELEGFIKWTGSQRPIEYTLERSLEEIKKWKKEKIDYKDQ
jgi:hypothetical protein